MNRVVIVTGGSRGIGKAICRVFAESGDAVVINYSKSESEAVGLRDELSGMNSDVSLFQADVQELAQARKMAEEVVQRHGRIDVLVNNAGIIKDSFLMLMTDKDWRDVINVNLTGVFNCSKAVSEYMVAQRSGAIINISSLSGITGLPGQVNYAASKGGVIAFTKALAKELARFRVRVNAVAPGLIEGEMADSIPESVRKGLLENIPMKRAGLPAEVASVVKFLASEDASYITGEVVCVTGGLP